MAGLDLFERFIVVDVLGSIVEIDQYLGIAVWKESVDGVGVFGALEVNERIDELIERCCRNVGLKYHRRCRRIISPNSADRQGRVRLLKVFRLDLFYLSDATLVATALEIRTEPGFNDLGGLFLRNEPGG